ncbi:MAG: DUF4258 domain-containing protein [Methanosarcinales archaeon]
MKITIKIIRNCFTQYQVKYSDHALYEMKYEEKGVIKTKEVYEAVMNGEIIEEYPDDKPFPSVLINGKTKMDRNIHVVCAYSEEHNKVIIITVYEPDLLRWESDYKKRRKNK